MLGFHWLNILFYTKYFTPIPEEGHFKEYVKKENLTLTKTSCKIVHMPEKMLIFKKNEKKEKWEKSKIE